MAAATESSLRGFFEETICSTCLEYFKDPVTIECGHNFCRACLTQSWEGSEGEEVSCPKCRQEVRRTLLFPNWQLANLAEKLSRLEGEKKASERNGMCEKHQEPIKLFCHYDESLICMVCDRSKEHRGHQVLPLEEAALEYQELITNRLELLKEERATITKYKAEILKESQDLFKQTEAEKEKMKEEFRKLHQYLEEQEKLLLAQLEETEKEIARKRDEHMARFSEELSSLEVLIQEMEQKRQQPPRELLQDIGSLLQKSEKKETSENPVAFRPELKWKIRDFCDINPLLDGVMNQFKVFFNRAPLKLILKSAESRFQLETTASTTKEALGTVPSSSQLFNALLHGRQLQKATVTLDPERAHPQLIVPEDRKSVTYGMIRQHLHYNPQRFDTALMLLGNEGFIGGKKIKAAVRRRKS